MRNMRIVSRAHLRLTARAHAHAAACERCGPYETWARTERPRTGDYVHALCATGAALQCTIAKATGVLEASVRALPAPWQEVADLIADGKIREGIELARDRARRPREPGFAWTHPAVRAFLAHRLQPILVRWNIRPHTKG